MCIHVYCIAVLSQLQFSPLDYHDVMAVLHDIKEMKSSPVEEGEHSEWYCMCKVAASELLARVQRSLGMHIDQIMCRSTMYMCIQQRIIVGPCT